MIQGDDDNGHKFKSGDEVQSISDPSRIGAIVEICELHAGVQWYRVSFGAGDRPKMPEPDLRPFVPTEKPCDNLISGKIDGYREFQRLITHQRLLRDHPLRNNIYAFNASRTRFYPYQFKPLIKFLDSPQNRLLIADEVGLGKTIEAGLIMIELRARQTVQRVLIVCPANLTVKWQMELKKRFGEEFEILNTGKFLNFLNEYEDSPYDTVLNGIISYESVRQKSVLNRLDALSPHFDLIIADEAHWMRNFGRKQRNAGVILSGGTDAMLFLTATPIHLGSQDLFSLLNILDEDEFPDIYTADSRFKDNEPVILAQICMGRIPPNAEMAAELLEKSAVSVRIRENPLYNEVFDSLNELNSEEASKDIGRRLLLKVQKDLAELNLLGHIFTRTRKREVQTNFPTRRAFPIRLDFTDFEKSFYDAVTDYVRAESELKTASPILKQWILNTPQRRMASSIPAMVEYYKENIGLNESDHPEDLDFSDEDIDDVSYQTPDLQSARERLKSVLRQWPEKGPDSKFEQFINILQGLRKQEKRLKIMVFAFFKDTLRYLKRRLNEEGFKCDIISGDVHPLERTKIIDKFKENIDFEILLSSKVGSEGLDFQFCDILFNYDLPWNPMEVEQRIGRLDRIGQESKVIRIYNFWIEGTIEQRILDRLYTRIGIFERSVGELEMILGDELSTLERDILSKRLTPEEENELLEQKARAIEERLQSLEKLEKNSARFIGTDLFFENEVEMIKKRRRFVTGEQMRRFVIDFLKNNCAKSRLEYNSETNLGKLFPDDKLRGFLIRQGVPGELIRYMSTINQGVPITFDAQTAFDNPKCDFLNVLHPLTQAIVKHYSEDERLYSNVHFVVLETDNLSKGYYFYFIYKLKISAARGGNTLEMVLLDAKLNEAGENEVAEETLGEMVEKGEDSNESEREIEMDIAEKACHEASKIFLERVSKIREQVKKNNDQFVDGRLESLRNSYGKNIDVKMSQLEKASEHKQDERYIRMLKGTIKRLETELGKKQDDLNKLRALQVEYDEIAAGILEIT
jgi:superfamily II DNA or RNA helicase